MVTAELIKDRYQGELFAPIEPTFRILTHQDNNPYSIEAVIHFPHHHASRYPAGPLRLSVSSDEHFVSLDTMQFKDSQPQRHTHPIGVVSIAFGGQDRLLLYGEESPFYKKILWLFRRYRGDRVTTYLRKVHTNDRSITLYQNPNSDPIILENSWNNNAGLKIGTPEVQIRQARRMVTVSLLE